MNGAPARASRRVKVGDRIEVTRPRRVPTRLLPEDIPLEALQSKDDKVSVPPLVGALLKNEQDVSLFEKLVFMQRHNR